MSSILHPSRLKNFLERFDSFQNSEIREINIISPSNITLTLAVQDKARAYDWISLEISFNQIDSANLLENSKLQHINMDEGISLTHNGIHFAFKINSTTFFIESREIKYLEGQF